MSETFDLAYGDRRGRLVEKLRRRLGRCEASGARDEVMFPTGTTGLDRLLAASPLRYGMLVEWLGKESSRAAEQKSSSNYRSAALPIFCSSTATLSLLSAREACRGGGALVVIDRQQTFYPPAAAAWGIDLERLIVVRPRIARDELWAAVQALRSPAVAALWAAIDRLDSHAFRRLQLAAQGGRTLGLIMRPASARAQPSWADVTLEAGPLSIVRGPLDSNNGPRTTDHGRRIQVQVLRTRWGRAGGSVLLEIDDAAHTIREVEKGFRTSVLGYQPSRVADSRQPTANSQHDTHPLPLVAELADSATHVLSARA